MVRVIVEHRTKDKEAAERLIEVIRELRNEAMKQPGYITGETLADTEDPTSILVISTWQTPEDWDAWDTSETRRRITEQMDPLLAEPYSVRKYTYCMVKVHRVWSIF